MEEKYQERLKRLMDEYAHSTYRLTRKFPKEELFGITSQLRRAVLSIVLNYIEGYARRKNKVNINFLEISYGSLQEVKYLLKFCTEEELITEDEYKQLEVIGNEIGAMLWKTLESKENYD